MLSLASWRPAVPLDAAAEAAFADEITETNRRRLRVLLPLFVVLHVAHCFFFWVPPHARAGIGADVLRWRDALVLAHGATLVVAALLTVAVLRARSRRVLAWLGPATALVYLEHGAIVAGIDQIVAANISVYIGYCIGVAVVARLSPRVALAGYLAALATLAVGLALCQRTPSARLTNIPTCVTVTVFCIAFAWQQRLAQRREFAQRATIARQQGELATLNASLSQRVAEQVGEIRAHLDEVERLNTQLRAQVRERSEALSLALARLASQRTADGNLPAGRVLAERFTVGERLGRGGMGTVYAGVDATTGARVAIKVIQATSIDQREAMRRFLGEARAAATVAHPAVVRALHVDVTDDGLLFQVQELVDGERLGEFDARRWPAGEAARLGAVLCQALAAAHAQGVVHCDVKPDNVMLTRDPPGLKLVDFGIAKLFDPTAGGTTTPLVLGTRGYMAPEQEEGRDAVTDRADLFAVGVLLFQLVAARLPEEGERAPLGPEDERLTQLVSDLRARDPAARPSARAAAASLTRIADERGAPPLVETTRALLAVPRSAEDAGHLATVPQRRGGGT